MRIVRKIGASIQRRCTFNSSVNARALSSRGRPQPSQWMNENPAWIRARMEGGLHDCRPRSCSGPRQLPLYHEPLLRDGAFRTGGTRLLRVAAYLGGVLTPDRLRFQTYRQWAEEVTPLLRAALTGEREVPPQAPFSEAWLAYSHFREESTLPVPLEDVIFAADGINHAIPGPDEIAWAFLRLSKRGWLVVQGDAYGLAPEGRRSIIRVVGEGTLHEELDHLERWISAHPPPSDE